MDKLTLLKHIYGKCDWQPASLDRVRRLMDLVAAEEREACADICDIESNNCYGEAQRCEDAIRARGHKQTREDEMSTSKTEATLALAKQAGIEIYPSPYNEVRLCTVANLQKLVELVHQQRVDVDSESTDIGIAQKCAALIRARSET